MTLPHQRHELHLVPKLCQFLQPKCHPLLLDTTINAPDTVRLNIYQVRGVARHVYLVDRLVVEMYQPCSTTAIHKQMHLLAAMKLHCYVRHVNAGAIRPVVLLAAIERGMSYCRYLIRSRMAAAQHRWGLPCAFGVPQQQLRYLAVHAFVRILRRKHQHYELVLARLEGQLAGFPARVRAALAHVVDAQRSAVLLREVVF